MPRSRLEPAVPDAPRVSACLTVAAERRVRELARRRGSTRSAVVRELVLDALGRLDADGRAPPDGGDG